MIADPELPEKARSGRLAEIRRCISCQNCIDSMEQRFAMDCAVNPRAGRELELAEAPAERSKRVVVIGSGPGGLEAARVAAMRGHRVTLHERNRQLGGALLMASTVHPENQPFLDYLLGEVARLGVDVRLRSELDAAAIARLAPDAVVVATGGRIEVPTIPGAELSHVWTGTQLRELLAGRVSGSLPLWLRLGARLMAGPLGRLVQPRWLRLATRLWMPIGKRVVIVGADLAAVELAEFLAERGRSVSVLEQADGIALEVGAKRRTEHMERLDRARVPVNTGVRFERITREGVVIALPGGGERVVPADTILLAGEVQADTSLYDALKDRVPEVHAVGDCTGLGLIQKAVLEGARAACAL
jgi:2,4-dienoyl-CoA reductase (NADPH2)